MEIQRKHVEIFMVASFLIKNHGYKFVTVHQNEDELWLGNPSNIEFPVIRVSSTTTESVFFERNRILEMHNMILKVLKREGRLLDLHISEETSVDTDPDFEQAVLKDGVIYGKNLSYYFPLLKSSITPFSDAKEEFARLNRDLEDYQTEKKEQKKKLKKIGHIRISHIIIAICVLVFIAVHSIANLGHFSTSSVAISLGAYYRNAVTVYGQYWRFITVGLFHVDVWHLLMNMYSLWIVGPQIEEIFGKKQFLLILVISVLSGSALMYVMDNAVYAVGLSGGIYGLVAAFVVFSYTKGLFKIPSFRNSIFQMLMINLLINFMPGIAVSAHIGGFIGGLLTAYLIVDYKPWQEIKKHTVLAVMLIAAFLAYRSMKIKTVDSPFVGTDIEMVRFYHSIGLDGYADRLTEKAVKFYNVPRGYFE